MSEQSENGKRIESWTRTAITVGSLLAGLAYAWGVLDARLNAIEKNVARIEKTIDAVVHRELQRLDRYGGPR